MISPIKIWRNQKNLPKLIGQTGSIISWTIIRVAPEGFTKQSPYSLVLVSLDNGSNITAELVDYENSKIHVGQRVITIIRRTIDVASDEVIAYGIKVKLI